MEKDVGAPPDYPPTYAEACQYPTAPPPPGVVFTQPVGTAPPVDHHTNMSENTTVLPQPSTYGSISEATVIQVPADIIIVGGCPACRVGVLDDDYTCCGICCAILLFPVGILCCLAMKQKRCSNCHAEF